MTILKRTATALVGTACLLAPVQYGLASSPNKGIQYHADIETNPNVHYSYDYYLNDPQVGQLLRCAGFLDGAARLYFGHGMEGDKLAPVSGWTPRMTSADVEERNAYVRTSLALVEKANGPAQSLPDYGSHSPLSGKKGPKSYDRDAFRHASSMASELAHRQIRGGIGIEAMSVGRSRCFDLPEIAPLQSKLQARFKKTVPGMEIPASSRIKRGRLPKPLYGYLYQPDPYRYLTCASIAYVVGVERFGLMPNPGSPDFAGAADALKLHQARLEPTEAAAREAYRKAVADTFNAGLARLGLKTEGERASYRSSFQSAESAVRPLVEEGLAEDLMAEPMLQCGSLPSMAPFIESSAGSPAAGPLEPPGDIRAWPERATGYLAHPVAFRNIFCSALIYSAYTMGEPESRWFAPPSDRDDEWSPPEAGFSVSPGQGEDRAAIKALVYALYDAGQIDQAAKNEGKLFFSTYARDYGTTIFSAESILKNRQGMAAMAHGTTNCFALPQVAPIANAVKMKVGAWDKRQPSSF